MIQFIKIIINKMATSGTPSGTPGKRKRDMRSLNTSNASRGVWLVKVPNYVSERWKKAKKDQELGKMRITRNPNNSTSVQFFLASELLEVAMGDGTVTQLPKDHRVNLQETKHQSLSVFTESQLGGDLVIEGKISQRAEIQPVDSSIYMSLKKHQIQQAEKTKFTASHLNELPSHSYKPVAYHPEHEAIERKKKEPKKARDDKNVVFDLLFSAFQRHQYYTFKDLVDITQQPATYLKEILKEVCIYNTKSPHKYMWELKPEYSLSQQSTSKS